MHATQRELDSVTGARDASERMRAFDLGQSDDLTGAMLSSAQADLSFSLLMRTRDKVVGAVEEWVRMPF
ncbi:flagellar hook-basal body complex protein FliE [Pandoraea sp. B-6]|uniref:flagellar hook-basal body complex protein FliE n=1 Tax=Pandoraea sp. B-6 TaxID=1204340 RepID=UPI00036814FF|nr:flagellar hook-basal body complex protein FliE [Pandoraea sp. B-6]